MRLHNSSLGSSKLKKCLHSSTIEILFVTNNFIKILLTQKSRDCMSALVNGQTSKPYRRTGKHLELIKWRITSTVAVLKSLPKIALTYRNLLIYILCLQVSNERMYTIELQRGARGFGFSIRGGREFNNMPLFILKIADGGSAHVDGRLRVTLTALLWYITSA